MIQWFAFALSLKVVVSLVVTESWLGLCWTGVGVGTGVRVGVGEVRVSVEEVGMEVGVGELVLELVSVVFVVGLKCCGCVVF